MNHLDLFSGIGGFALAVDEVWPGSTHTFCEIDEYCSALLKKRFPNSLIYGDIKELTGEIIWKNHSQRKTDAGSKSGGCEILKRSKNTTENILSEIGSLSAQKTEDMPKRDEKANALLSCGPMARNAPVAERRRSGSFPSTIKTMTDTVSENSLELLEPTEEPPKLGSPTHIKYCALTATLRKEFTDNAHTKRRTVDILTAGVPCQPASCAGKRRGTSDDRWLWGEAFRVIKETEPRFVILENVRGILTLERGVVFESLLAQMEALGYETRAYIIPAVSVNAPHRRDRVWFVAHNQGKRWSHRTRRIEEQFTQGEQILSRRCNSRKWNSNWLEVATRFCGVDDGLPAELDGLKLSKARHRVERLKALGNAIVPQVAVEIMKAIKIVVTEDNQ